MQSKAKTVAQYLASLPEDRRHAIEQIRKVINQNIDRAFEEGMQYGMLGWFLPHSKYPAGYHCDPRQPLPFCSVASQKNHIGLYLFCIYFEGSDQQLFVEEWKATGKRLDMGKSCVRVKNLEGVALDVLGRAIKRATAKRFVEMYEASVPASARKGSTAKKKVAKKAVSKKKAAKKKATTSAASKKASAKKTKKKKVARKASPEAAAPATKAKAATKKKAAKKRPSRKTR